MYAAIREMLARERLAWAYSAKADIGTGWSYVPGSAVEGVNLKGVSGIRYQLRSRGRYGARFVTMGQLAVFVTRQLPVLGS